jgi:predicted transcriptional regulator YdeE
MHIKKKLYIVDSIETNNFNDPLIMQKIDGLWQKAMTLCQKNQIKYGVYHDYESDFKGNYTISVATDADNGNVPLEVSGEYMVFDVDVKIENPILESWKKIWSIPLDRAYTFDFEQYNLDGTIQIYIALKMTKAESNGNKV